MEAMTPLKDIMNFNIKMVKKGFGSDRVFDKYKDVKEVIEKFAGVGDKAAEMILEKKPISIASDFPDRVAEITIEGKELKLLAPHSFVEGWVTACSESNCPPVFYSLYTRKVKDELDFMLFDSNIPVLTLIQKDRENDNIHYFDGIKDHFKDAMRDAVHDKTFFVVLPRKSPGCTAAHEFLRLLYLTLRKECRNDSMDLFILADDDIKGSRCHVRNEVGEKFTKKTADGKISDLVRNLTEFVDQLDEKPLVLSLNRAHTALLLPTIYNEHGDPNPPRRGTKSDSFLLIHARDNNIISNLPFCSSSQLLLDDDTRQVFKWLVGNTKSGMEVLEIEIEGKKIDVKATRIFSQFEDYFFHMLLAHTNKIKPGLPRSWMIAGAKLLKSDSKGNTTNIENDGLKVAQNKLIPYCRLASMLQIDPFIEKANKLKVQLRILDGNEDAFSIRQFFLRRIKIERVSAKLFRPAFKLPLIPLTMVLCFAVSVNVFHFTTEQMSDYVGATILAHLGARFMTLIFATMPILYVLGVIHKVIRDFIRGFDWRSPIKNKSPTGNNLSWKPSATDSYKFNFEIADGYTKNSIVITREGCTLKLKESALKKWNKGIQEKNPLFFDLGFDKNRNSWQLTDRPILVLTNFKIPMDKHALYVFSNKCVSCGRCNELKACEECNQKECECTSCEKCKKQLCKECRWCDCESVSITNAQILRLIFFIMAAHQRGRSSSENNLFNPISQFVIAEECSFEIPVFNDDELDFTLRGAPEHVVVELFKQKQSDLVLSFSDVSGKRLPVSRIQHHELVLKTIREEIEGTLKENTSSLFQQKLKDYTSSLSMKNKQDREVERRERKESERRAVEECKRQAREEEERQRQEANCREVERRKREESERRTAEECKRQAREEEERQRQEANCRELERRMRVEEERREREESERRAVEEYKRQAREEEERRRQEANCREVERRRREEEERRKREESERRAVEEYKRQAEEEERRRQEANCREVERRKREESERRAVEEYKRQAEEEERRRQEANCREVERRKREESERRAAEECKRQARVEEERRRQEAICREVERRKREEEHQLQLQQQWILLRQQGQLRQPRCSYENESSSDDGYGNSCSNNYSSPPSRTSHPGSSCSRGQLQGMSISELRTFVGQNGLDVRTNTGGYECRTKNDIVNDILREI